jgi:F0F1-type ATP synthase assembly protein I
MKSYIVFASIGFELVGLIVGCFYLGEFLDGKFHTKGLFFVGLSVISLIGWLIRVIWLLKRIQEKEEFNEAKDKLK